MTPRETRQATPEREDDTRRLFAELRRTGATDIRARLVRIHENLARFLACKFINRGEPLEDLTQVALIGLIHAVDRFDPSRGIKFSTYATPTIVGEIKRHFRDRAWNLKVPRCLQELNQHVVSANQILTQQLGRSPTIAEIAAHVGCSEEKALAAIEIGSAYETISLESTLATEDPAAGLKLNELLGFHDASYELIEFQEDLKAAIEKLDRRERTIIQMRFFQELSQTEVARRLRISQMHVSRLQHGALQRLRGILGDRRGDSSPQVPSSPRRH